jgi:hypothetical protein
VLGGKEGLHQALAAGYHRVRVLGGKGGLHQALAAGDHRVRVVGGVGRECIMKLFKEVSSKHLCDGCHGEAWAWVTVHGAHNLMCPTIATKAYFPPPSLIHVHLASKMCGKLNWFTTVSTQATGAESKFRGYGNQRSVPHIVMLS